MFDIKLIPEFDGSGSIVDWLEKVELVCQLRDAEITLIIPLRLTDGAFAVYQQLPENTKKKPADLKKALTDAFAADQFTAYDEFIGRKLKVNESVDVFLADLRTLSSLFWGVSDTVLCCAFVSSLPESC